jgi:hypothetical protein
MVTIIPRQKLLPSLLMSRTLLCDLTALSVTLPLIPTTCPRPVRKSVQKIPDCINILLVPFLYKLGMSAAPIFLDLEIKPDFF